MVYTLRFFFSLFHNSNVFGSCVIHILYTGCAKIKKIFPAPKGKQMNPVMHDDHFASHPGRIYLTDVCPCVCVCVCVCHRLQVC